MYIYTVYSKLIRLIAINKYSVNFNLLDFQFVNSVVRAYLSMMFQQKLMFALINLAVVAK